MSISTHCVSDSKTTLPSETRSKRHLRTLITLLYELAIKDGGYAIFENVITDSIVGAGVSIQVKNAAGGTLSLRSESKKGDVISKCELPGNGDASKWTEVKCSNFPKLEGVQDFYLTAEGLGGETFVGNIKFGKVDTSSVANREVDRAVLGAPSKITYDRPNGLVRLSAEASWSLFDMNGVVVKHGYGREIRLNSVPRGLYLVRSGNQTIRIRR